eukprot:TRINITY_DN12234_c0_g1_i1.p2 TRINITY_DN12234_c0_g1~~TRINITY_DN12234_c0_g1_i1.p2  ORF type:complete len:460 (+),score=47.07 TRINITY_DN12234_c0_g1_i1:3176-4555(+)
MANLDQGSISAGAGELSSNALGAAEMLLSLQKSQPSASNNLLEVRHRPQTLPGQPVEGQMEINSQRSPMRQHSSSAATPPDCQTQLLSQSAQDGWKEVEIPSSSNPGLKILVGHSGIANGKKVHRCIECNKDFPSESKLIRHSRVHTKEKPFKCPCCEQRFTQRSSLKQHLTRHTDVDPSILIPSQRSKTSEVTSKNTFKPTGRKPPAPSRARASARRRASRDSNSSSDMPPAKRAPLADSPRSSRPSPTVPIPPLPSKEDAITQQAESPRPSALTDEEQARMQQQMAAQAQAHMRSMFMMMSINPLMAQQIIGYQTMCFQQAMMARGLIGMSRGPGFPTTNSTNSLLTMQPAPMSSMPMTSTSAAPATSIPLPVPLIPLSVPVSSQSTPSVQHMQAMMRQRLFGGGQIATGDKLNTNATDKMEMLSKMNMSADTNGALTSGVSALVTASNQDNHLANA